MDNKEQVYNEVSMPQSIDPNRRDYRQLALSQEEDIHPRLVLDGQKLSPGTPLVLYIQATEIAGHVEFDQWGWYLDTNEVAIMLHAGLWARLPREGGVP